MHGKRFPWHPSQRLMYKMHDKKIQKKLNISQIDKIIIYVWQYDNILTHHKRNFLTSVGVGERAYEPSCRVGEASGPLKRLTNCFFPTPQIFFCTYCVWSFAYSRVVVESYFFYSSIQKKHGVVCRGSLW